MLSPPPSSPHNTPHLTIIRFHGPRLIEDEHEYRGECEAGEDWCDLTDSVQCVMSSEVCKCGHTCHSPALTSSTRWEEWENIIFTLPSLGLDIKAPDHQPSPVSTTHEKMWLTLHKNFPVSFFSACQFSLMLHKDWNIPGVSHLTGHFSWCTFRKLYDCMNWQFYCEKIFIISNEPWSSYGKVWQSRVLAMYSLNGSIWIHFVG